MVAKNYNHDINLQGNEIQNGVFQNVPQNPENPKTGQFWFDTADDTLKVKTENGGIKDALSQGKVYTQGTGILVNNTNNTISVDNTIAKKSDIPTNYVPNTRTVNGKALSTDIILDADDIGALPDDTFIPTITDTYSATSSDGMSGKAVASALGSYVPTNRTVNGKPLTNNISLTASDVSALADSTKYGATIDISLNETDYKLTLTLKDQDGTTLNTKTVDFPIESVVVGGSYDSANQKIVLTLQNGTTVDVPVGDLIAGLQTEITSTNKLSSDLVDDSTSANKFVSATQRTQIGTNATNIGTIQTTIGGYGNIVTHNVNEFATAAQGQKADTALQEVTESDVTDALGYTPARVLAVNNPALTVTSGSWTWSITNSIGDADVIVQVRNISTNAVEDFVIKPTANTITIQGNASANIAADTYRAVIIG